MTIKETKKGKEEVAVTLEYKYNGKIEGYPFPCRVRMTYKLNEKGFSCKTKIKNIGAEIMPLGDGWHPYFKLDTATIDDLLLKLPFCEEISVDDRKLPTNETAIHQIFTEFTPIGTTPLDNGYRLLSLKEKATTCLQHPTDAYQLQLIQDTGKHKYNYLQVYTPTDRKTIAIEPMSCATNAFNNGFGLISLKPDSTYKATYKIRLKRAN
jgi:aldose 1-epimerase